jgi:hypothetical protein
LDDLFPMLGLTWILSLRLSYCNSNYEAELIVKFGDELVPKSGAEREAKSGAWLVANPVVD